MRSYHLKFGDKGVRVSGFHTAFGTRPQKNCEELPELQTIFSQIAASKTVNFLKIYFLNSF